MQCSEPVPFFNTPLGLSNGGSRRQGSRIPRVGPGDRIEHHRVVLDGSHLSYRGFVGGWDLELDRVEQVEVPSCYRLIYLVLRSATRTRKLPLAQFKRRDLLADALLGALPEAALSSPAIALLQAIRAGAQGYLLKDIPPDELVHAIREASLGKVQLHPEIAKKLMSAVAAQEGTLSRFDTSSHGGLTEREQEVLYLIADGLSNHEIAEKLVISEKTVKTHVSNILSKLHLEDRTQAAIYALKHGIATDKD